MHVATWIEADTRKLAAPSVKQRLAAIRHLFGQVVVKPAGSLGPRHVVASGRTPVLDPSEARGLLDSIDSSTHAGLRDRALIALMVYSLARIGAAVEDVYTQNPPTVGAAAREGRQAACEPSQPRGIPHRPSRRGGTPRRSQGTALPHDRARHRPAHPHGAAASERLGDDPPGAAAAGIATKLDNHNFRATEITAYLKKGGTFEKAAAMGNHALTRTTQFYDRRRDEVSLDEVERVVI